MTRKEKVEAALELIDLFYSDAVPKLIKIIEEMPKPCKHEPWDLNIDKMIDGDFITLTYTKREGLMTAICKCGAKIKATGWEPL